MAEKNFTGACKILTNIRPRIFFLSIFLYISSIPPVNGLCTIFENISTNEGRIIMNIVIIVVSCGNGCYVYYNFFPYLKSAVNYRKEYIIRLKLIHCFNFNGTEREMANKTKKIHLERINAVIAVRRGCNKPINTVCLGLFFNPPFTQKGRKDQNKGEGFFQWRISTGISRKGVRVSLFFHLYSYILRLIGSTLSSLSSRFAFGVRARPRICKCVLSYFADKKSSATQRQPATLPWPAVY